MSIKKVLLLFLVPVFMAVSLSMKSPGEGFMDNQLKNSRVLVAKNEKDAVLKKLCQEKGIAYPIQDMFIRVFKKEAQLEVWAKPVKGASHVLLKNYKVCVVSGGLGPKRQEGDGQTPEGFYHINDYNPLSSFYLSLGVSYPNASDKIKTTNKARPGGLIYIHGNCVSIGCMPIEDDGIKEVYWMAVQAKEAGQGEIGVHIFPFKMNETNMKWANDTYKTNPALLSFWANLLPGYQYFEKHKTVPGIKVGKKGEYVWAKGK